MAPQHLEEPQDVDFGSSVTIEATVGVDVTLACRYDAKYYGPLPSCWGRGSVPTRGCMNEVINSDGTSVTSRMSERYLLMGDMTQGDVSLTVRKVQHSDSGTYGCRVHVPGLFNDLKYELTLVVVPAPPKPIRVAMREVRERTIALHWTAAFDGGSPITGYDIEYKSKYAAWDTAVSTRGLSPMLTQATLVDMHPFTNYNIRMFARNSVGLSEASNTLSVTTKEAVPSGPPLDLQLEALTPHSIKATWRPPRLDLRNGVISSYSISYRGVDVATRQYQRWHRLVVTATGERETAHLDNLRPSTKYSVVIQAKNNAGIGPATLTELCSTLEEEHTTSTAETKAVDTQTVWYKSSTGSPLVVPDPPILELVEVKDGAVSIRWTSGFDGGSPITSYDLEYKAKKASWDSTKRVGDFSGNWTETTIIEMHASTYNIRLFARNRVGVSVASNELTVTTGEAGQGDFSLKTLSPLHTVSSDTQAVSLNYILSTYRTRLMPGLSTE
ncbi:cell adhesion molecule DSCAM-like [Aplochiton taeniatus]